MQANSSLDTCIKQSSNPEEVSQRLDLLLEQPKARSALKQLSHDRQCLLIRILDISDFLYRFLNRHPDNIALIGTYTDFPRSHTSLSELILFKYQTLLQITAMDLKNTGDYQSILLRLSKLANYIIEAVHAILVKKYKYQDLNTSLTTLALGKLGANEINYSSDIDLMFISTVSEASIQACCTDYIRKFCQSMEAKTEEGFLYRVDLNLRPWGKSAPLVMGIDATEQYYEASKEAWERFAWLRARPVAGNIALANELIERLQPFIFHRALSTEDIDRFLQIKLEMAKVRQKKGEWNIKTGVGGIRDIEFFVHLLQIINGAHNKTLRLTNTLDTLAKLNQCALISEKEYHQLKLSYIFLRRLEHRVQMQDEQQTHALPDDKTKRIRIANAMGYPGRDNKEKYEQFLEDLLLHRQTAKKFFDGILSHTQNW